ncbi:hypothetical protein LIER_35776 [Lithospermum erythrorhizon]|uniref:Uncharacterized protein n=1 Tax=Lithospermum erythrorhizon TaxID=34254 RepID=A0AAV3NWK5_LITER
MLGTGAQVYLKTTRGLCGEEILDSEEAKAGWAAFSGGAREIDRDRVLAVGFFCMGYGRRRARIIRLRLCGEDILGLGKAKAGWSAFCGGAGEGDRRRWSFCRRVFFMGYGRRWASIWPFRVDYFLLQDDMWLGNKRWTTTLRRGVVIPGHEAPEMMKGSGVDF